MLAARGAELWGVLVCSREMELRACSSSTPRATGTGAEYATLTGENSEQQAGLDTGSGILANSSPLLRGMDFHPFIRATQMDGSPYPPRVSFHAAAVLNSHATELDGPCLRNRGRPWSRWRRAGRPAIRVKRQRQQAAAA